MPPFLRVERYRADQAKRDSVPLDIQAPDRCAIGVSSVSS